MATPTPTTPPDRHSFTEFLGIGADHFKPTYSQLREEGVSPGAIETLMCTRDLLADRVTVLVDGQPESPEQRRERITANVLVFLRVDAAIFPLTTEDVWPNGVPEHWVDWSNYDPTDAELEVAWNAPDAPAAHRAAWALHIETRS